MAHKFLRNVPIESRENRSEGTERTIRLPRIRLGYGPLAIVIVVIIVVLVMITVPLRNYMEQRAEIARLNASISHLTEQKKTIEAEIDKFQSEEYVREQARIRLGVIEPGEIAFRIIDPALENNRQTGESLHANDGSGDAWFNILWDSISTPEALESEETAPQPAGNLPLAPDPNAPEAPVQAPPAEVPPAEAPADDAASGEVAPAAPGQ